MLRGYGDLGRSENPLPTLRLTIFGGTLFVCEAFAYFCFEEFWGVRGELDLVVFFPYLEGTSLLLFRKIHHCILCSVPEWNLLINEFYFSFSIAQVVA